MQEFPSTPQWRTVRSAYAISSHSLPIVLTGCNRKPIPSCSPSRLWSSNPLLQARLEGFKRGWKSLGRKDSLEAFKHPSNPADKGFKPVGKVLEGMERFRISSVAKSLGVSTTTIYKHLKRLQTRFKVQTIQEAGVTYLTEEGVDLLREAMAAAQEVVQTVPPAVPVIQEDRLSAIEKSILALVDEVARLKAENQKLRQERRQPTEFERFYLSFFQPVPQFLETAKDRYYHQPLMIAGPDLDS